jgi:ribonucleoside-diphosphate reductase alpha chain
MGDKAKRPAELHGNTYKIKMPKCGTLFVTVNLPLEVICRMGRSQGCQNVWIEAVSRMVSLALQSGADVEEVIEQLQNLRCEGGPLILGKGKSILSCPDGIAKSLKEEITSPEDIQNGKEKDKGAKLVYRDNIADQIA